MLDRCRLQFNGSCNNFRDREEMFGDRGGKNLAFLVN